MPDLSSSQLFWSPDVSYVCLSVCKLFIFTSSDEEPLGQIQPNMTQSIVAWSVIKFVQMKSLSLFLIMYLLIWTNQVSDVAHGSIVCFSGGETIRWINQESGAHVELQKHPGPNPYQKLFSITGTPDQIELAIQMIREIVGSFYVSCFVKFQFRWLFMFAQVSVFDHLIWKLWVSFSDHLSSVYHSLCLFVGKMFTFQLLTPEPVQIIMKKRHRWNLKHRLLQIIMPISSKLETKKDSSLNEGSLFFQGR